MIDYKTVFTHTNDVDFPDTRAVDASGATATDGTEFIAALVDDLWGARQAIMNYAGLSPDSVREQDGASQALEALQRTAGGPGERVDWMSDADPATLGRRLLLLQGQGVLRANYPDLDDAVYVGDGNNGSADSFFHADNADGSSRNTGGAYLILADARGLGIRGTGSNADAQKADGSAYAGPAVGSVQTDQMQQITGRIDSNRTGRWGDVGNHNSSGAISASEGSKGGNDSIIDSNTRYDFDSGNSTAQGGARTGDETRMAVLGCNIGIRY